MSFAHAEITTVSKTSEKKNVSASQARKADISTSVSSPFDHVLYLQRHAGNQAVQKLIETGVIQAKLEISQPSNIYEQEADAVAEQIVNMPWSRLDVAQSPMDSVKYRKDTATRNVEIQPIENGEVSQLTSSRNGFKELPIGEGQPLPASERKFLEHAFGYDFSKIKIHTDSEAAESAEKTNALAYAIGQDIIFGKGKYSPATTAGKHLLAHELAHVIQQTATARDSFHTPKSRPATLIKTKAPVQMQFQMADKNNLAELEKDVGFILKRLDSTFYTARVENDVVETLKKWAYRPTPEGKKSKGSWWLEQILFRLRDKHIDVGILAEQRRNYYDMILNHFDRAPEILTLVKTHAPLFRGVGATPETSFGGYMWEQVKSGKVEKQIYAYGRGLKAGVGAGLKGIYDIVRHPIRTAEGVVNLVVHYDKTKQGLSELVKEYIRAAENDPEKFAEMTGSLAGQIDVALVTPGQIIKGPKAVISAIKATRQAAKAGKLAPALAKGELFYKPAVRYAEIPSPNPKITIKGGATRFGDITINSKLPAAIQKATLYHEKVHSFLSPKFRYLREFRANLKASTTGKPNILLSAGEAKSPISLIRYVEEALAETYKNVKTAGPSLGSVLKGIRFPIKNGYVALSDVLLEGSVGAITYGSFVYYLYVEMSE